MFFGLSLADISIISVVALPLYPGDIQNQDHYSFGNPENSRQSKVPAIWTSDQTVVNIKQHQLLD